MNDKQIFEVQALLCFDSRYRILRLGTYWYQWISVNIIYGTVDVVLLTSIPYVSGTYLIPVVLVSTTIFRLENCIIASEILYLGRYRYGPGPVSKYLRCCYSYRGTSYSGAHRVLSVAD
jgi:hypothetical protein